MGSPSNNGRRKHPNSSTCNALAIVNSCIPIARLRGFNQCSNHELRPKQLRHVSTTNPNVGDIGYLFKTIPTPVAIKLRLSNCRRMIIAFRSTKLLRYCHHLSFPHLKQECIFRCCWRDGFLYCANLLPFDGLAFSIGDAGVLFDWLAIERKIWHIFYNRYRIFSKRSIHLIMKDIAVVFVIFLVCPSLHRTHMDIY
jgi:hypothetical protein